MADDTDAVVSARIALLDYHRQRGLLFPGMDERNQELHGLIDALIAAVRAECEAASDERAHNLRDLIDELRERVDVLERRLADISPELR